MVVTGRAHCSILLYSIVCVYIYIYTIVYNHIYINDNTHLCSWQSLSLDCSFVSHYFACIINKIMQGQLEMWNLHSCAEIQYLTHSLHSLIIILISL